VKKWKGNAEKVKKLLTSPWPASIMWGLFTSLIGTMCIATSQGFYDCKLYLGGWVCMLGIFLVGYNTVYSKYIAAALMAFFSIEMFRAYAVTGLPFIFPFAVSYLCIVAAFTLVATGNPPQWLKEMSRWCEKPRRR